MDSDRNDLILKDVHWSNIHRITIIERFKYRFAVTSFLIIACPTRLHIAFPTRLSVIIGIIHFFLKVGKFHTKVLFGKFCKCRPTVYGVISSVRLLFSKMPFGTGLFTLQFVVLILLCRFGFQSIGFNFFGK